MVEDHLLLVEGALQTKDCIVKCYREVDIQELLHFNLLDIRLALRIFSQRQVELRLLDERLVEVQALVEVVDLERHLELQTIFRLIRVLQLHHLDVTGLEGEHWCKLAAHLERRLLRCRHEQHTAVTDFVHDCQVKRIEVQSTLRMRDCLLTGQAFFSTSRPACAFGALLVIRTLVLLLLVLEDLQYGLYSIQNFLLNHLELEQLLDRQFELAGTDVDALPDLERVAWLLHEVALLDQHVGRVQHDRLA